MSPVAVSADRRFHRAYVKPARKPRLLRKWARPLAKHVALALVLGVLLYRGVTGLADTPLLRIGNIVVGGNHRMPTAEVLAALDGLRGENIVWSDLDHWRDRLLATPWVRDVTFRRSLPSTIEVEVTERAPLGIGRRQGHLFLMDERGQAIDDYGPQYADLDLPMIDGLGTTAASDVDGLRTALASRLLSAIAAKPALAARLSQVDVSDPHNASVILNGDSAVIFVGEDRFLPRLESYLDVAAALRERVADIDYVDLRFDERIYVRPSGAGKTAARRGGGRRTGATGAGRR
jgi:cell division protein FtsQ